MALSLKVEVAFNAGYATAAGSRTWTDISAYVELAGGIDIKVGRQDELSTTEPNTLTLTLDNSDGRFTPERSSSPYYPNVKLYRPIRVTATLPDASTSVRFLGFVTQWPTSWPGGSAGYASSTLSAVSRIQRLGETTALRTMVENEILVDSPSLYYTLGEATGATLAANSSATVADPLSVRRPFAATATPVVTFGTATGPPTDDMPSPTFNGTGVLAVNYSATFTGTLSMSAFFLTSTLPSAGLESRFLVARDNSGTAWYVSVTDTGAIRTNWGGVTQTSALPYADGQWHHVGVTLVGSAASLYVDDVPLVAAGSGSIDVTSLSVGGDAFSSSFPFSGSVAHVSLNPTGLTSTQVLSDYRFGLTTVTDSTNNFLQRIAHYGGVPLAEVGGPSAEVVCRTPDTSGKTVLDALRDIEATEAGALYDTADGMLILAARSNRYTAPTAFTLDASLQHIGADLAPLYDTTKVINEARVTSTVADGNITDVSSQSDYGNAVVSRETLATDPDEPTMIAGWLVNSYAQPRTRVPSLTVDVLPLASGTPSVMNLAAATVGTLFGVSNLPAQFKSSTSQFFVEGYSEHFDVESWAMTFNVSPAEIYTAVFTLEDATLGQYDAYGLAL